MTERVNHAMETTVTPLPNGLYLLKGLGDEFVILYPSGILNAVDKAHDARLKQEKSQHCAAMDEINNLNERIALLERDLAAAKAAAPAVKGKRRAPSRTPTDHD